MHDQVQTIARLKSMIFLIEEALRIADEGDSAMLGAKLSDCIDCLQDALASAGGLALAKGDGGSDMPPRATDATTPPR